MAVGLRVRARDDQEIDPLLLGERAQFAVQLGGVAAEFAHRAEHGDAPPRAGKFLQGGQRRLHGGGIRIVGVVMIEAPSASITRMRGAGQLHRRQAARDLLQAEAAFASDPPRRAARCRP